ncbi:MAG: 16S rRNA (guanine(966)-N(2))-methyltransferase RsmD [Enterobacterales bacterium]|nr:16S rRNA (guanine(966)-N(2))-methyltransferase RsmD [Enterobacterales bacterium]
MRRTKKVSQSPTRGKNQLRIIGGSLRGRKIDFYVTEGLRPTLDRVRETLFNWLMGDIAGASCLDLFAGSGALGYEALSRGAKHVSFVEPNPLVSQQIKTNLNLLSINNAQVYQQTADEFLNNNQQIFDLVFLDPPFAQGLLQPTLKRLCQSPHLAKQALIYIEQEAKAHAIESNDLWRVLKSKHTSRFNYQLVQLAN